MSFLVIYHDPNHGPDFDHDPNPDFDHDPDFDPDLDPDHNSDPDRFCFFPLIIISKI